MSGKLQFVDNNLGLVNQFGEPDREGAASRVPSGLMQGTFDPGWRKPYLNKYDVPCVNICVPGRTTVEKGKRVHVRKEVPIALLTNQGRMPAIFNSTALPKETWIEYDRQAVRAARRPMRFSQDIKDKNSFGGFNGMAKTILEYEAISDVGEAIVDMTGLGGMRRDTPQWQLRGMPLPITHIGWSYGARQLAVSRATSMPLDTTMAEMGGRRIGETLEKTAIGNQPGLIFGGTGELSGGGAYDITSGVYGVLNFPNVLSSTGTYYSPTGNGRSGTGWIPNDTYDDFLLILQTIRLQKFFGPFSVYTSDDWSPYLDRFYFTTTGVGGVSGLATMTLRKALEQIDGVEQVVPLWHLFSSLTDQSKGGPGLENVTTAYPFTMLFVQHTPEVLRWVNGMDVTTLQWETHGGLGVNFEVMTIQAPQARCDEYGNVGMMKVTFNHS